MTNLLRMCSEPGCKRIMVENKWVGREYKDYQKKIDEAEHITHGYCPTCTKAHQEQIKQRRERINSLGY